MLTCLLASGTNKEVAQHMQISESSVATYKARALEKLNIHKIEEVESRLYSSVLYADHLHTNRIFKGTRLLLLAAGTLLLCIFGSITNSTLVYIGVMIFSGAIIVYHPRNYLGPIVGFIASQFSFSIIFNLALYSSIWTMIGGLLCVLLAVFLHINDRLHMAKASLNNSSELDKLTQTEKEIFSYLVQGVSIQNIAERRVNSINTIARHRANIYKKLDVHSQRQLISKFGGFDKTK